MINSFNLDIALVKRTESLVSDKTDKTMNLQTVDKRRFLSEFPIGF